MKLKTAFATLALSAALAAPLPAHAQSAWETSSYEYRASVSDKEGRRRLVAGCYDDLFSMGLYLTVYTGEAYDPTASYAASVPLVIESGGAEVRLSAKFRNFSGELVVSVYDYDDSGVFAATNAMRNAQGPITVSFFDTRASFPDTNAREAIGWVVDFVCI